MSMDEQNGPRFNRESADFNAAAVTWDEKPQRVHLACAVAKAIREQVPLTAAMQAMEFGCGTGLVSFHLVAELGSVVAMDSAASMLEVLQKKATSLGVVTIRTALVDAGCHNLGSEQYDLVYSSMVLHHVPHLEMTLRALIHTLKPGGYLALADLDEEDGSFHDNPAGVERHGVDRIWLTEFLRANGLQQVEAVTAHTIGKQRESSYDNYPVFLVCGRRPLRS
ncbi:MAG: methyltransferase domain-containing protein [Desulfuromonadaceae bacterium]|nr:methyltransferase domain-containing protein [Desulfuromonadaceae bacterium]